MSPEQRLQIVEEHLGTFARALSTQAGTVAAMNAAIHALILVIGDVPLIRQQLEDRFERVLASMIGGSTNELQLQAFEAETATVRAAMDKAKNRAPQG